MLLQIRLNTLALAGCVGVGVARISTIITTRRCTKTRIIRRICKDGTAVRRPGRHFWRGGIAFAISIGGVLIVGVGGVGDHVFFVFLEGVAEVAGGRVGL